MAIFDDEGINEDHAPNPVGEYFGHLLYYRAAEAMPHQNHVFQAVPLNVSDDRVHAILVSDAVTRCLWAVPREGWSMRHMPPPKVPAKTTETPLAKVSAIALIARP